jgi:hypothetical protein
VSDPVLTELTSALEMVLVERLSDGTFQLIGDAAPPQWFVDAWRGADPGQGATLSQAFPVLSAFLSDAEVFWQRSEDGRLQGEAFVITDASGQDVPVSATAMVLNGRRVLLIQRAPGFEERQRVLQRARVDALSREEMVRQLQKLHRPVEALAKIARDLAATPLTDEQRAQTGRIREEVEELQRVLDQLPRLPRSATPHRR